MSYTPSFSNVSTDNSNYIYGFKPGYPEANEVLFSIIIQNPGSINVDMPDSIVHAGEIIELIVGSTDFLVDVVLNNVKIGELTWFYSTASDEAVFSIASYHNIYKGDILKFVTPAVITDRVKDISFSIKLP